MASTPSPRRRSPARSAAESTASENLGSTSLLQLGEPVDSVPPQIADEPRLHPALLLLDDDRNTGRRQLAHL
eukprot:3113573-Lingulodinium_polyedra.AAC.1